MDGALGDLKPRVVEELILKELPEVDRVKVVKEALRNIENESLPNAYLLMNKDESVDIMVHDNDGMNRVRTIRLNDEAAASLLDKISRA